ncbi:MAG: DUF1800 family protein, partial [Bacteroidetes bacterium]|nr:DUF1800 family protein [Bacteroidota bacterium]
MNSHFTSPHYHNAFQFLSLLTGEFQKPRPEIVERNRQIGYMGQVLLAPPSVEGWHQGLEWIDSGTLVERLNFATQQLGNRGNPGVEAMIDEITNNGY